MSEETISGDGIDRVFDSGYKQGSENERERIIALLEFELNKCDCEEPLQHLATLIKGENE